MLSEQNIYRKERVGEELAYLVPCCFTRGGIIGCDSLGHRAVGSWQKVLSQSTELGGQRRVTAEATRFFSIQALSQGARICVQHWNLLISGNILKHQYNDITSCQFSMCSLFWRKIASGCLSVIPTKGESTSQAAHPPPPLMLISLNNFSMSSSPQPLSPLLCPKSILLSWFIASLKQ